MTAILSKPAAAWPNPDRGVVALVTALFVVLPVIISGTVDTRLAALFLIGGLMGAALWHASFGFTGGWRRMVTQRRGRAMRAQMAAHLDPLDEKITAYFAREVAGDVGRVVGGEVGAQGAA